MLRTFRFLLKWGFLLTVAFGAVVAVWGYLYLNDEVKVRAQSFLSELFPQLEVTIQRVELNENRGLLLRNVLFCEPPTTQQRRRKVLFVPEIAIQAPLSLETVQEFFQTKKWTLEFIELNRPSLFLTRDDQGQIREKELFKSEKRKDTTVPIIVNQGKVQLDGLLLSEINMYFAKVETENDINDINDIIETSVANQTPTVVNGKPTVVNRTRTVVNPTSTVVSETARRTTVWRPTLESMLDTSPSELSVELPNSPKPSISSQSSNHAESLIMSELPKSPVLSILSDFSETKRESIQMQSDSTYSALTPFDLTPSDESKSSEQRSNRWEFQGTANSEWSRTIHIEGEIDLETEFWRLNGSVEQIQCCEDLWTFLLSWKKNSSTSSSVSEPDRNPTFLGESTTTTATEVVKKKFDIESLLRSIRGAGQLTFALQKDLGSSLGFSGEVNGSVQEGRAKLEFFQQPLSELVFDFNLSTKTGLQITNCSGQQGDARLFLSYQQENLRQLDGSRLQIWTQSLLFDKKLANRLARYIPPTLNDLIGKFHYFSVLADFDLTLCRESGRWIPSGLKMEGRELNFLYSTTPYPVEGLAGSLVLDKNRMLTFRFATPESKRKAVFAGESPNDFEELIPPFASLQRSVPRENIRAVPTTSDQKTTFGFSSTPTPQSRILHDEPYICIRGDFQDVLNRPFGQMTIHSASIPINTKLMNTIPEKSRRVVQSLRPTGTVSSEIKLNFLPKKQQGSPQEIKKDIAIYANDCSVYYDQFPYPVREINGVIKWDGTNWLFSNFTGSNELTKVKAQGNLNFLPANANEEYVLTLMFDINDMPLEGPLQHALLNPSYKELHASMRGTGRVDAKAQVRYFPTSKQLNVWFDAEPEKSDGLTICPTSFPLKIEGIQGKFSFNNGLFTVKNMSGRHKDTHFMSDINCQFSKNGAWEINLSPLVIDQCSPQENEFLRAMPEHMQFLVKNMKVQGPVNFDGNFRLSRPFQGAPLQTNWSFALTLHQNGIDIGVPVQNIFGRVHLAGHNRGGETSISGNLELDSARLNGLPLTNVSGPFYYDGDVLTLGERNATLFQTPPTQNVGRVNPHSYLGQAPTSQTVVPLSPTSQPLVPPLPVLVPPAPVITNPAPAISNRASQEPIQSFIPLQQPVLPLNPIQSAIPSEMTTVPLVHGPQISAELFGGTLLCQGAIRLFAKKVSYDLHLDLHDSDLQQMVSEFSNNSGKPIGKSGAFNKRNLDGLILATVDLHGEGRNPDTLSGNGSISLRNAYLYETPVMIKIMQRLSVQIPDRSAFSSGDIQFRIQGKKILLHTVRFDGSVLSLEGNGDMKLDGTRSVNLILKTRFGGTHNQIPVLGNIINGSRESFNQVHIEGPLNDPEVQLNPLPGMRNAIEQFQGEPISPLN
ncbi:MAG: AsmA-like C-terminal domain-containing protein [Thermoguttaceae bacterium]